MNDITLIATLIVIYFIGYLWGKNRSVKVKPKNQQDQDKDQYNYAYIRGYLDASQKMMQIMENESVKTIDEVKKYYDDFPKMGIN
tara:strand:- start:316 stop:570 length:255 start_codon:yes stop_codon:yes gene_type:complete